MSPAACVVHRAVQLNLCAVMFFCLVIFLRVEAAHAFTCPGVTVLHVKGSSTPDAASLITGITGMVRVQCVCVCVCVLSCVYTQQNVELCAHTQRNTISDVHTTLQTHAVKCESADKFILNTKRGRARGHAAPALAWPATSKRRVSPNYLRVTHARTHTHTYTCIHSEMHTHTHSPKHVHIQKYYAQRESCIYV